MKKIKKMVNKWLNRGKQRKYIIHEQNGQFVLCKVLNKYDTKADAIKDMSKLITSEISELDIIDKRVD